MSQRLAGLVVVATVVVALAASALGDGDASFVPLFDGKTLEGWTGEHTDRFSVKDGVIVNDGSAGWLRWNTPFKDFEFYAQYRALRPGAGGGLLFRSSAQSAAKDRHWPAKGYQLQVIDSRKNLALLGCGVAPPKFSRKLRVLNEAMKGPGQWQTLTLTVVGPRAEAALGGTPITVCETIELREGYIGLRGERGALEWRNLRLKELPAR